jgi:acyl-coenzyme A synthetase/AMP-(fatty) acid ligase/acyl carrier protein
MLLASFVHVASLPDIYAALLNGAAVCLYDIKNEGMTGLPDWLRNVGVTIYHSVPTVYRLLLDSAPQSAVLQGIRAVVLGGEEVFMRDIEAYQRTFGDQCVFVNMYGSTESTVTTMGVLNKASRIERDPVPVGMPVGANEVLLLGSSGKPTSIVGEIAVRNPYLPADHWNRHGSESPFYLDAGNRYVYRTGDHGRLLTDGTLVLLGRKDFQVKIRGFRVELGEIEAVMSRCAGVGQAIVVARKDPLGNKRLAAYIVPAYKEAPPDPKELRNELRQLLPAYMVPELIVQLEKVAYTATGKIDRNNLPVLDWSEIGTGSEYVEPRNDLEQKVCGIWREVLKLERISVHDNFFDLGGHSLLAIQILERIRKECNVNLPIHELFGMPTIAAVAAAIGEKQRYAAELPADAPLVPVARRRHVSAAKEGN